MELVYRYGRTIPLERERAYRGIVDFLLSGIANPDEPLPCHLITISFLERFSRYPLSFIVLGSVVRIASSNVFVGQRTPRAV